MFFKKPLLPFDSVDLSRYVRPPESVRAKFFEILIRNGISTDLDKMTVAMHIKTGGGKHDVTFSGVGAPIPENVLREIRRELFPLIEHNFFVKWNIRVLLKPMPLGQPKKEQDEWNKYCELASLTR